MKHVFVSRVSRYASLVEKKDGHQVLCKTQQVCSENFTYDDCLVMIVSRNVKSAKGSSRPVRHRERLETSPPHRASPYRLPRDPLPG